MVKPNTTTQKLEIKCGSCGKYFPLNVKVKEKTDHDPSATSYTYEVYCPFCKIMQAVELPMGLADTTEAFKGIVD